ncbi:MAG TPA: sortase [Rubrobacter sp.]|nr:sortase [Rubrobacter sp.]
MFREGNSLLIKVGLIMVALAFALVIGAIVVSVTLGSEAGRVATDIAKKSVREAQRDASGKQEESLGYGSSSSAESMRQRKEDAKEPVAAASEPERSYSRSEMPQPAGQETPSELELRPQRHQTQAQEQPLPAAEDAGWPAPTQEELQGANGERHYELLPGAVMGLTIHSIGVYNAPVFDSDSQWALATGVAHVPETSLPWSQSAQRNVYLAGHRMGYRGTWSRMIFYNLDKLKEGDKVVLKDRTGRPYEYRVSETFLAEPSDSWVMGQVRGRDMVTLQTCTPIPTFQKRLIVRADRV